MTEFTKEMTEIAVEGLREMGAVGNYSADLIVSLEAELDKHRNITKRIAEYFCSDKALCRGGTMKSIYTDANNLLPEPYVEQDRTITKG